jgi:hypothetical protein
MNTPCNKNRKKLMERREGNREGMEQLLGLRKGKRRESVLTC